VPRRRARRLSHAGRSGYHLPPTMSRRLARKNIMTALIIGAICMFMFGLTFIVAAAYVS
jgi:hypothetical protein